MMSDASALRPALSFAFLTQSLQYVPQYRWRDSVTHDLDLQKYYYAPEITLLQQEAASVQALGAAAAEEWLKGLQSRGQFTQSFATRCEAWELNGGLQESRKLLFQHTEILQRFPSSTALFSPPVVSGDLHMLAPLTGFSNILPMLPLSYGPAPGMQAPPGLPPRPSDTASIGSQASGTTFKTAPSSSELARIRAYKKNQLVERCRAINPPIHREMLERLDAYHSALQIPMMLNDNSWDTLKPILLTQRKQLELQDEARNSVTTAPTPGQFTAPPRSDEYVLAHADDPMKDKLCEIAKEYIKQRFGHGGWVTYPTAPQFAAEVLIHTRQMYVQERQRSKGLRSHDPNAPEEEMLRFEHMKWVFDQTIRPQTEQIRKDLFLCARCPPAGAPKYFAFESIVQHFASKHDPAFTCLPPKAFWKCEWTEIPPFNAHPERVHTPEPSTMHTPTLSHHRLPAISPSSILQTIVPPGRRTPDTMSLLSGNTNPFSASGRSVRKPSQVSHPAAPVLYELQRDSLAVELNRGWKLARSASSIPLTLQLYLALGFAIIQFTRSYRNEPPLKMLEDCLAAKSELRELKNLEPLRCAECVLDGREEVQMEWSLQDLTAHFRKMHIENSETKSYWKDNMLSLPEPGLIKRLLSNDEIPTVLHNLLQDAETTAVIQKATTNPISSRSIMLAESGVDINQMRQTHPLTSTIVDHKQSYPSARHGESQYAYPRTVPFSTAAAHSDLDSSRDTGMFRGLHSINTNVYQDVSLARSTTQVSHGEFSSYMMPATYTERLQPNVEMLHHPVGRRFIEPRAEAMSRSDTMHSQRSRGDNMPRTNAEDFLSALDAHLDTEMAGCEPSEGRGSYPSQPVSRTSSTRGPSSRVSHRISINHGDEGDHHRWDEFGMRSRYQQASQPTLRRENHTVLDYSPGGSSGGQVMEKQRSRMVEFDLEGNPIASASEVYQEPLPPHTDVYKRYVDETGHPTEASSRSYGRQSGIAQHLDADVSYAEDQRSRHAYVPFEYGAAQRFQQERVIDSVSGGVYVLKHPARHLSDEPGGLRHLYDDRGQRVHYEYRPLDYEAQGADNFRYEREPSDYQDRRYQGR